MGKHSNEFYVDGNVIRWKSNNSVPPVECLDEMLVDGDVTNSHVEESKVVREKETAEFLAGYRERMSKHVPSDNEMFEMRAAFGEGETVVNAITGKTIHL